MLKTFGFWYESREAWASYISYWISASNLNHSKENVYIVLDLIIFKDKDE